MQWLDDLTFEEVRELSKYTDIKQYEGTMSSKALYLYLLTNKPSIHIVQEIINKQQPRQIIQLILNESLNILLHNPLSPNVWTAIAIQQSLTLQQLQILLNIYFNSNQYVIDIDVEQRQEENIKLKKNIFIAIKESINKVEWVEAVRILQTIYLRSTASLEDSLKIIELFFNKHSYRKDGLLEQSDKLRNQLLVAMKDVESVFVSQLAINVYCQLCRVFHDDNPYTQCYVNLYSTLNSYGVHLIKDVWDDISIMINKKAKLNYIQSEELLKILFVKVWHHKNENVPKHCVKDFLKSQKVNKLIFLSEFQEVAYGIFIEMLNSGQFYTDSLLLMDSSFYKHIGKFYASAFEVMEEQQQKKHLNTYFNSVADKINNDQAIPAFMLPFKNMKIKCRFFNKQLVQKSIIFINRVYNNLHVRKRWQLLDTIIECLKYMDDVPLQSLISLITTISEQAYSWSFIHDRQPTSHHNTFRIKQRLKQCLKSYDTQEYMQYLSQNDIDKFYKMSRLISHPLPDIHEDIKNMTQSCYSTINHKTIRHLHWQLQSSQPVKLDMLAILQLLTDKRINDAQLVELATQFVLTRQPESRKYLAQFTEWVISNIHESYQYVEYLLAVLKCHCRYPSEFIQQCFYSLKLDVKEHRGLVLRVKLHLAMLLSQDNNNLILKEFLEEPIELIDRYDYRQFPEMGVFLVKHYIPYALKMEKYEQVDQVQMILKRALVTNLEYSMQKEEVMCYTNFIFDERLVCCRQLLEKGYVTKWVAEAFKVGKDNIVMKRPVIDQVFLAIQHNLKTLIEQNTLICLVDVVLTMLQAEQYRGFDGEILFYEDNQHILQVRKNIPKNGQYFGAYPRFLFMDFISRIIRFKQADMFAIQICQRIILESIKDESANKMLFTPPFRKKLRLWQAMQLFMPFLDRQPQLRSFMLQHMGTLLEQSNQYQIKFYIQLFFTRLALKYPSEARPLIVSKMRESGNSLNNSITYLIIGGLMLEKQFDRECFTVMLTYVCANTAYLRGLAQYFCFTKQLDDTPINKALYRQYLENPDSIRLVTRLDGLITEYRKVINSWSFEYFCGLEFYKAGEIIEQYHLDGLKKIGLEIVQDIKNTQEDFVGFKDVWKKEKVFIPKGQEQAKSFQRKIDPVVEEVYEYNEKTEAKTKLRIVGNSIESLSNCGHLVRTSQIFSVEELAISDIKILDIEAFKIVSCTGEKWLPIREVRPQDTLQYLCQLVRDGYQLVTLFPSTDRPKGMSIPKKAILMLGNDNKELSNLWADMSHRISFSHGLSLHVECAIAIWQYVKEHVIQN